MRIAIALLTLGSLGCASLTPERQRELDRDLVIAAFQGDPERVAALIAEGADVDGRCGKVPNTTFMNKEKGFPMASAQWTPLIAAASSDREPRVPHGHHQVTRILIDRGASLDLHDGKGATALYRAVYEARRSEESELIVHDLLAAGANANIKVGVYIDGSGDVTPLHRATGKSSLVDALIRHGGDVDARTTEGDSILHWAVGDKDVESVRLLLKAGAKVNVVNHSGRTPLSRVSSVRRHEDLRRSILKDVELTAEDRAAVLALLEKRGIQPLDDPSEREIERLLRAAGASD